MDYPDRLNIIIYNVLSKHLKCTCDSVGGEEGAVSGQEGANNSRHFAVLLLKPTYSCTPEDQVPFDMLISTMPVSKSWLPQILWQDIQLLVSR